MSPTLLSILAALLGFVAVAGFGLALAGQSPGQARVAKRAQAMLPKGSPAALRALDLEDVARREREKQKKNG